MPSKGCPRIAGRIRPRFPRRKTTKVTWLTDRTTLENIKVAIANLGYDADDIEAEEYAFKRLPKDCKAHKAAVPKPAEPVKN